MLTLAILTLLAIGFLALHIRPAQDPDPKPVRYNPVQGATLRFLFAFVWSLRIHVARLVHSSRVKAQVSLLLIRQALATMHFGRGLLHG